MSNNLFPIPVPSIRRFHSTRADAPSRLKPLFIDSTSDAVLNTFQLSSRANCNGKHEIDAWTNFPAFVPLCGTVSMFVFIRAH